MSEDNLSRQIDEVEALASIYDDEWCVVDAASRVYCIEVTDGQEKPDWTVCLQVILPPDYPSDSPPQYQLNAPWMIGQDREELSHQLEAIFCENIGESIVYMWVEQIREFLMNKGKIWKNPGAAPKPGSKAKRQVHVSEETDHDFADDGFDLAALEEDNFTSPADISDTVEDDVKCPEIHHGGTVADRRSVFQAHLAPVTHSKQVKMVLDKLCENKKIAAATHNIIAYRIIQGPATMQGCEDDGEIHAGSRMLHLLNIVGAMNVMVVVTRWYGGVHLGPDRFKHINNCTRQILEEHGYIQEKGEKKGPKSSKKGK